MLAMAAHNVSDILRQPAFLRDLKAAARQDMNEDNDEDGSSLNMMLDPWQAQRPARPPVAALSGWRR